MGTAKAACNAFSSRTGKPSCKVLIISVGVNFRLELLTARPHT
jgi:hypothetical protein